jgi:hypothetical protein
MALASAVVAAVLAAVTEHMTSQAVVLVQERDAADDDAVDVLAALARIRPDVPVAAVVAPSAADLPRILQDLESKVLIFCQDVNSLSKLLVMNHMNHGGGKQTSWLLGSRFTWLLPESPTISHLPLRLDSHVVSMLDQNGRVFLEENYKVKSGPLLKAPWGFWSEEAGLVIPQPVKWTRRQNLGGATIVNTVLDWFPVSLPNEEGTDGGRTGLIEDIVQAILANSNSSLAFVSPDDGQWGGNTGEVDEATGVPLFNGMVGMLQRKEADICTSGVTITGARSKAVDFSMGVIVDLVTLIQFEDKSSGSIVDFFAFANVFPAAAWLLAFLSMAAIGAYFAAHDRVLNKVKANENEADQHILDDIIIPG